MVGSALAVAGYIVATAPALERTHHRKKHAHNKEAPTGTQMAASITAKN